MEPEVNPDGREELPVIIKTGTEEQNGFLVRVGSTYFFEDANGRHVSVHVWRLRNAE